MRTICDILLFVVFIQCTICQYYGVEGRYRFRSRRQADLDHKMNFAVPDGAYVKFPGMPEPVQIKKAKRQVAAAQESEEGDDQGPGVDRQGGSSSWQHELGPPAFKNGAVRKAVLGEDEFPVALHPYIRFGEAIKQQQQQRKAKKQKKPAPSDEDEAENE